MKKLILCSDEVYKWIDESFQEYASETVNGKRLRFLINFNRIFRVTYDKDILFEGNFLSSAIRAFNLYEE